MQILETYTVKPDSKGRLALPSGLRKALGGDVVTGGFFLRRSMHGRCLEMYPSSSWEKELEKVQGLNPYVREHRSFIRRFMAGLMSLPIWPDGPVSGLMSYFPLWEDFLKCGMLRLMKTLLPWGKECTERWPNA